MISKIAFLALTLTLGAAVSASAQDHPNVAYQKTLLARSLETDTDKEICARKADAGDTAAQNACRVTRLFLADIQAKKVNDRIFPPMADIKYTVNKPERLTIMERA